MKIFAPSPFRALTLAACGALALSLPAKADLTSNLQHIPAPVDSFFNLTVSRPDWGFFLDRKPFSDLWKQMRGKISPQLEAQLGVSIDKDILPMVGSNINVAAYQADLKASGERLPFLILLDIKDLDGYAHLLARLKQLPAKDKSKLLLEYKYQGVPLYGFASVRAKEGVPYMALDGHTMMLGSKSLVMKAIDSGLGKQPSALSDAAFRTSVDALGPEKFWLYANPRALPEMLGSFKGSKPIPPAELAAQKARLAKALEMYDAMGIGLDLNPRGLAIRTVARVKENSVPGDKLALMQNFRQVWNDPASPMNRLMQAVPPQPLLFASLNGIDLVDRATQLLAPPNPEKPGLMDAVSQFFAKSTKLDFRQDLIKYSDGRGGFAVYYPEEITVPNRPPQAICYLGVRDNAAFLANLQSKLKLDLNGIAGGIDSEAKSDASRVISFPKQPTEMYNGHPLYIAQESPMVSKLRQGLFMQPTYGNYGNLWLFASSPEAFKRGIDNLDGKRLNLANNPYFNQLKDRFGIQANGGLMFIELSSAARLAELLGGDEEDFKALKPTLLAFKSIMAGGSYRGNVVQGNLVMDIDMAQVNFELMARIFNSHFDTISDPTRKQLQQPAKPPVQKPGPKPGQQPVQPVKPSSSAHRNNVGL